MIFEGGGVGICVDIGLSFFIALALGEYTSPLLFGILEKVVGIRMEGDVYKDIQQYGYNI